MPAEEYFYQHYCMQLYLFYFQNHDDKLTFDEFLDGSKKDPTIIQALTIYDGSHVTT